MGWAGPSTELPWPFDNYWMWRLCLDDMGFSPFCSFGILAAKPQLSGSFHSQKALLKIRSCILIFIPKISYFLKIQSVHFSRSVVSDSLTPWTAARLPHRRCICCRQTGLPVHHQLPELAQTHVHRVGDAIQPSHPLSSPSPTAFNFS